jgi:Adenylate and Guanylate cyclase catalytic domain
LAWSVQRRTTEYGECFAENKIDLSILPHLTDQDLKDTRVPLGHRRKRHIHSRSACSCVWVPEAVAALGFDLPPTPEASGERRRVTVTFCDLADSSGIAAQLDAEEWRDLIGAYLDAASTAVTEMAGKVAKKLGDRLMALFGYPLAQENDAERAVRAALAILSLAELKDHRYTRTSRRSCRRPVVTRTPCR